MKILSTEIRIDAMRFHAYHGVLEQERAVGGDYSVTLRLWLSAYWEAVSCDSLEGTVNYAEAYALVEREMRLPSALIEHVAGRILSAVFFAFPRVAEAEVEVRKMNPPMGGDCAGAAVVLRAARA